MTAVNVKSELAESGVRVWVSVYLGQTHAQERAVTSYILHEGEKVTVRELIEVGVEPFEIKLVRLPPLIGEAPKFVSKAGSIELVAMEPSFSTLPAYKIVVRNLSARNVAALRVQTLQNGRSQIMSMPQGKEGAPLIEPGGTYEISGKLATRSTPTPDGYSPVILPNQVIEISSAIFDDGSFEGDSDAPIAFAGFQKGRKIILGKVLSLFEKSLTADDSATPTRLDWLKSEVAALKLEADPIAVKEVQAKLGALPGSNEDRIRTAIEVSMTGMRGQVLNDITQFQLRNRRGDNKAIYDWLAASKGRYEAWFARL